MAGALPSARRLGVLGWRTLWLLPLFALLAGPRTLPGEGPAAKPLPVRAVKAGYLYKFTRYVDWPAQAFKDADAAFVIGVLKDQDNVVGALTEIVSERKVGTHPIVLRSLARADEAAGCHILYVPGQERQLILDAVKAAGRSPVLLVGDRDDILNLGGAIGFLEKDNTLRIRIRPAAARRNGVEISAKLNPVAEHVDRREMPAESAP